MHSPNKLAKTESNQYESNNEELKLLMNNLSSVDSMLMHNYSQASPHSYSNQQQHHAHYQQQYRRVRPEPINEKSIVGSVVGFFHDVVGSSENHHNKHAQRQPQHHGIVQSGSSTLLSNVTTVSATPASEIKEQIEWLHFEHINLLDSSANVSNSASNQSMNSLASSNKTLNVNCKNQNFNFSNNNILLVLGYKTGFSVWNIDLNGVATEVLSIREPNITHVKLLQYENQNKILIAICKLIITNSATNTGISTSTTSINNLSNSSTASLSNLNSNNNSNSSNGSQSQQNFSPSQQHQPSQTQQQISIVNLINGECLHEILFNGDVLEMKSNANLLCVNSWNRIDAFDLTKFEHRFSINCCYSQISKSSGKTTNPFTLGNRWLAFADNKFHVMLSSQGGVSTDIEQSYTAAVLNTAKSISKGLVKISEQVVNSVVSKSKTSSNNNSSNGGHSPRLASGTGNKMRHDSKEDYQAGICTIVDTKTFINNSRKPQNLHDENQNWIIAHFLAHQEPIYALEFNNNGRLMVSVDCLGQYFNVFQINANSFKCTRTVVKHLYSLYRGDTTSKVRNISFSNDSRWLAISTKRGTTHIFPLNSYGGPVNARTHSKPYVVNRTAKHQRTAGFIDSDNEYLAHGSNNYAKTPLLNNSSLLNTNNSTDSQQQHYQMQQMLQQQYDNSFSSPILINNNPKLKSLMEPFVIQAYGQLKQPNANSSFQSSVISSNPTSGLLTSGNITQLNNASNLLASNSLAITNSNNSSNSGLTGSNIAATALSSAALVTENMTNFGIKNFSLLASNTTNMIQYDNVCTIAVFAESRGYLSPEEPRDYSTNRLKPANSLFAISDVNGNLVEYVLDVIIDTSKTPGNKPTNDSPIQLKITPKAQWPLQRFVSSDELRYPLLADNPLLYNGFNNNYTRKFSSNSSSESSTPTFNCNGLTSLNINSYSPNSLISNGNSLFNTASNSLALSPQTSVNDEWIKMIDVNTHMGPHRRLFMGPQFIFKTFNSNLTTTKLNAASSSVISDVETPIIDLSGDIELNTLDLNSNGATNYGTSASNKKNTSSSSPMQINPTFSKVKNHHKFDSTPTYIEVGSFQEGMPILCGSSSISGSQKSLNNAADLLGDNLIESLADAMNELNGSLSNNSNINNQNWGLNKTDNSNTLYNHGHVSAPIPTNRTNQRNTRTHQQQSITATPAIAIANNSSSQTKLKEPNMLLMNANTVPITAPSSAGSNCSNSVFTVGSYFLINPTLSGASNIIDNPGPMSTTSYSSSSSSSGSSNNSSANCNNDDDSVSSNNSSTHSSLRNDDNSHSFRNGNRPHHVPSLENIQFQDDNLLQ